MGEAFMGLILGLLIASLIWSMSILNNQYEENVQFRHCMYASGTVTRESYEFCLKQIGKDVYVITDEQMHNSGLAHP